MKSSRFIVALSLILFFGSMRAVQGQLSQPQDAVIGGVSGTGYATIKRPPELLRMHLNLTASAHDSKAALAKVESHRDDVIQFCKSLGAAKDSLVATSPRMVPDASERQQRQSRAAGAKKSDSVINLSLWVTAEWPLPANDPGRLFEAAQSLSEKIKSGLVSIDAKQLSPEEQEVQEEAQGQAASNGVARPGEPILLFVAKIPPEVLTKSLADAFAMARNRAESVCKAAGVSRGDLQKLTDSDVNTLISGTVAQLMAPFDADNPELDIDNREEATGFTAGDVRRLVEVDATFRINKKP